MEIKIREKSTGVVYTSKLSEKDRCILSINFSDESTDFEVQDRIKNEDGKVSFKTKTLAIYNTSNLKNSVIAVIREEDLAEWVND